MNASPPVCSRSGIALCLLLICSARLWGADSIPAKGMANALPPEKWSQVEHSVDRALAWLASQQTQDGSFSTLPVGQPAVTSFCVMAFLSRGHQPGFGPYGQQLNRAIDFVLSCQKPDGLLCEESPEAEFHVMQPSHTATYNHAISGLMLGEVYGHVNGPRAKAVRAAINKALAFSRALQIRRKPFEADAGGVRYLRAKPGKPAKPESDLSATTWHLMFYRSAKNAGFDVPKEYADDAVAYARRCWSPSQHMFNYYATEEGGWGASRGTTGAGILSLSMAGDHDSPMAKEAGEWLAAHPYQSLKEQIGPHDRFFYSTYYCSQAAAQLGGRYWEKIFPPMVDVFLTIQDNDGSFPPETEVGDAALGNAYTTAMAVLAMTPAYQLLPVYQR